MATDILNAIEEGWVFSGSDARYVNELPWHEHPKFHGVSLKHLITGDKTGGTFSSHLVRVKSGCEIGEHIHEGKWELHEVIKGNGKCYIENKTLDYYEGVMAIVPPDTSHVVQAVAGDLYLLAKFIPALL